MPMILIYTILAQFIISVTRVPSLKVITISRSARCINL